MWRTFKMTFLFISGLLVLSSWPSTAASQYNRNASKNSSLKKSQAPITSEAGLKIPEWGIALDASYDARLDNLIPGYKIVQVVLSNTRPDTITLNPVKDRWAITDSAGKKHTAHNHVRHFNKKLWNQLKPELKAKLDYPTLVKSGHLATIDLFFPEDVDLFQFREIAWTSAFFAKRFDVLTNYEKNLGIHTTKNQNSITDPNSLTLDEAYLKSKDEVLGNSRPNTERQNTEAPPKKNEGPKSTFDPSFDDAIIIR